MTPIPEDTLERLRDLQARKQHAEELWTVAVQTLLDNTDVDGDVTLDLDAGVLREQEDPE